ncbi:MAG: SGNH/GDSL hydrolase family protein [Candidatus Limnocylindria bacterium]
MWNTSSVARPAGTTRALWTVAVTVLLGSCITGTGQSAGPSAGSPSAAVSPAASALASPTAQARYVALGDSTAVGILCECPAYPDILGQLASQSFAQPVQWQNLAVVRTTSADLLERLQAPIHRSALEAADLITISIGINDINACGDEIDIGCYEGAINDMASNLDAILNEIDALQAGHPHALRATTYYNFKIGHPNVAELGPSFQSFYAEQLAALNAAICDRVTAHGGICVDLVAIFNGAAGNQDAGPLLASDHAHPSREGHEAIADAIAASGFVPPSD